MSDEPRSGGQEQEVQAGGSEQAQSAASAEASEPESPTVESERGPSEPLSLLGRINLFAGLTPHALRRIHALGQTESHPAGALIFAEGTVGDRVYLILEGRVRISRTVPGMGEEALAVLEAGDYFGEMALIDDFPRSADARAHTSCALFVISKEHLQDLLFVDRDLAYDLLWNFVRRLSTRLRETNDKMTFLAVSSRF